MGVSSIIFKQIGQLKKKIKQGIYSQDGLYDCEYPFNTSISSLNIKSSKPLLNFF